MAAALVHRCRRRNSGRGRTGSWPRRGSWCWTWSWPWLTWIELLSLCQGLRALSY